MKKLHALAAVAALALLAACATGHHVYGNPDAPGKVYDCQPGTTCQ